MAAQKAAHDFPSGIADVEQFFSWQSQNI